MLALTLYNMLSCLQLNSDAVQDILAVQALDMSRYMKLFAPAVEWVLQCLGHRASTVRGEGVAGGGAL